MSMNESSNHRITNRWMVLVVLCLGMFLVEMDNTIVNVALPSIQHDLRFSAVNLQWVINAYLLLFGGFLLLGGRIADLFGRRRIFSIGLVVFFVGSIVNALAPSAGLLIAGRSLQGLAAATLTPTSLSTLNTTFTDAAERTRALAVWTAIEVGGVAIGLVLGGVITSLLSWRWIFVLNVVVALLALVGTFVWVPESRAEARSRAFDLPGAAAITAFLGLLVYTLTNGRSWGWGSQRFLVLLGCCAVLLAGFILVELRAEAPLVRLGIFKIRTLAVGNLSFLLVSSGIFGMFYFSSLFLQEVLGFDPLRSGLALLPLAGGVILGAAAGQPLMKNIGVRVTAVAGIVVAIGGMLILTRASVAVPYAAALLPGMAVLAAGLGLCMVPFTLLATTGVAEREAGLASGLYTAVSTIGGALGLAVLSTVAADRTHTLLERAVPVTRLSALVGGFHTAYGAGALLFAVAGIALVALLRGRQLPEVASSGTEASR